MYATNFAPSSSAASAPIYDLNNTDLANQAVKSFAGHVTGVNDCSWRPHFDELASCSDDTALIWDVNCTMRVPITLDHCVTDSWDIVDKNKKQQKIGALDWSSDGRYLLTASDEGFVRVWRADGQLANILGPLCGPLIAVKWNKDGNYIIAAGYSVIGYAWCSETGIFRKRFIGHSAPVLDVDWCNDICFASCSIDNQVIVYNINLETPLKTFLGHEHVVNSVRWDTSGTVLASCSDDTSVKIWHMNKDTCFYDLRRHSAKVFDLQWRPYALLQLASVSYDHAVCLWDVVVGECTGTLIKHSQEVYAMAFSPDGKYLATGGADGCVNIWSVHSKELFCTFCCHAIVFKVCWNHTGDKLGAGVQSGYLYVIDMKKVVAPPSYQYTADWGF